MWLKVARLVQMQNIRFNGTLAATVAVVLSGTAARECKTTANNALMPCGPMHHHGDKGPPVAVAQCQLLQSSAHSSVHTRRAATAE